MGTVPYSYMYGNKKDFSFLYFKVKSWGGGGGAKGK